MIPFVVLFPGMSITLTSTVYVSGLHNAKLRGAGTWHRYAPGWAIRQARERRAIPPREG